MQKSWHRFYFRFNCTNEKNELKPFSYGFMTINFSEVLQAEQPKAFVGIIIDRKPGKGDLHLKCRLQVSSDKQKHRTFQVPISANRIYCVESFTHFFNKDSILYSLYLNGDSLWSAASPFNYSRDFFEATANSHLKQDVEWSMDMDEFTLSETRTHTIPPNPMSCSETVENFKPILNCTDFITDYRNEFQKSAHWYIYPVDQPDFPVFNAVESDPSFFTQRALPFPLDSGTYEWKLKFRNNFEHWGYWSKPRRIRITRQRYSAIRISNTMITKPGKTESINTLIPETWYEMVFQCRPQGGWKTLGYLLAWLHHRSNTIGHPENKGGTHDPASNYIANLSSRLFLGEDSVRLYEKKQGSAQSQQVMPGQQGSYLDYTSKTAILDTLKGIVRIRFKLLNSALPGKWMLSAYARVTDESISNLVRIPVQVIKKERDRFVVPWGILILAGLGLVIILVISLLRIKRGESSLDKLDLKDEDLNKIISYINSRLAEDITTVKLFEDLLINKRQLHKIQKKHKIHSLPKLVNQVRIQKAKEMLLNTSKGIAEIGFETGFQEARYFTQVFKSIEGLTPREFRQKYQK
jgi:AraC-like DNA-binding protein